ncbi:hypothetical protein D3C78_1609110 [compost metagenome]
MTLLVLDPGQDSESVSMRRVIQLFPLLESARETAVAVAATPRTNSRLWSLVSGGTLKLSRINGNAIANRTIRATSLMIQETCRPGSNL